MQPSTDYPVIGIIIPAEEEDGVKQIILRRIVLVSQMKENVTIATIVGGKGTIGIMPAPVETAPHPIGELFRIKMKAL